jgi:hypothetical protein
MGPELGLMYVTMNLGPKMPIFIPDPKIHRTI